MKENSKTKNPPKIEIDKMKLKDNYYVQEGKTYSALDLIEHKDRSEPFDIPLAGIDISFLPFKIGSIEEFVFNIKRVQDCDLKYPILIDNFGIICDGWHRICKALLKGKRTIKAVRLYSLPTPIDNVVEPKE